ncbi:MAG: DUF1972 domain-containing protein [Bacteroidales bacterium]|jgi:hypothetical protein
MRKIAIIGSHGIYANYGGWDELVRNLAERKPEDLQYIIFNSAGYPAQKEPPDGVSIRQLKFRADGYQGLFYDFWSILVCWRKANTLLLLGAQGIPLAAFLRLFRKFRIVANAGGFEWERPKFGFFLKRYLKWCFNLSMRYADTVILDNPHYRNFLPEKVKADVKVIPYGGEIDTSLEVNEGLLEKYPFLDKPYFLSVSRPLKDNQLEELCSSFIGSDHTLVLISNFSSTPYGISVLKKYRSIGNLILINGLYVKPELDLIRRKCKAYIHTHTLCGTAPSLVEMIIAQRPVLSVDNPQNRNTLREEGFFYKSFTQVHELINNDSDLSRYIPPKELCDRYQWSTIVAEYESTF